MSMIKHSQGTQSNKFVEYVYNISEKKLALDFIFLHTDKYQSFYNLVVLFLMKVARHAWSTQNKKFVTLCNIATAFVSNHVRFYFLF